MNQEINVNEILESLQEYLGQQVNAVGEHLLIQHLSQNGLFHDFSDESASLQLFKKHFLTMHALYLLQESLIGSERVLLISPLHIQIVSDDSIANDQELGQSSYLLSQYYLDLNHFHEASEDTVEHLLSSFWKKFSQWQIGDDAFAVLGLASTATWLEVQKAYRSKAQLEHPDKGGDAGKFAEYTEAYQQLKSKLGSN